MSDKYTLTKYIPTKNINITDNYSNLPECSQAYRDLIEKRRIGLQEGGLTVTSSQTKGIYSYDKHGS